jgi:UDP-N-acetyl-D-glucosamine dehydrogenase
MNERKMVMNGSKILIVGVAYKKNVDDLRESPSFMLWKLLEEKGAKIEYYDPFCPVVPRTREYPQYAGKKSVSLGSLKGRKYDVALIATAHDSVNHKEIAKLAKLVIDTRNAVPKAKNVVKA